MDFRFLHGDLFELLPSDIQQSSDPEFRSFVDKINAYRDEAVFEGMLDGSLSIEQLDDLFKPEKVSARMIPHLNDMFDAGVLVSDTEDIARKKIQRAVAYNRFYGTVWLIRTLITEVTGTIPGILAYTAFNIGFDEDNTVNPTGGYLLDFQGGLFWDEIETYAAVLPAGAGVLWSIIPSGIMVDVKNDGAYTAAQWEQILLIVGENKRAETAAEVGYFDTLTGDKVVYATVYNRDATWTSWPVIADPGL